MYAVLDRIRSRCCVEAVMKASELQPLGEVMGWQCFRITENPEVDVEVIQM